MRIALLALFPAILFCQPTVRFETNLGNIDVRLLPNSAPRTVENFLKYMNRGAYNNSIFHRSVANFVIQGGGFQLVNGTPQAIPSDPPVINEYLPQRVSNIRGTIAMAKLEGDPNSATNQWFFNLGNNATNLDNQNGGFTVFGRVVDDASLRVMDEIAALPIVEGMPRLNSTDYVVVRSIKEIETEPASDITISGIVSASSFGGWTSAAPGSFIEIYGTNLAKTVRSWRTSDFTFGNRAPTSLDGVVVMVDGRPAYPSFISPTQINVQVHGVVSTNRAVPVVVQHSDQSSAPVELMIRPRAGGLLAPAGFNVNGKQYVVAAHSTGAFVGNGQVPDVPAAPASPGEEIVFYGTGFGAITPNSIPVAGQIVAGQTSVSTSVEFHIGETAAQVKFAGLVTGLVGVYQFNVVVPSNAPTGDLPVRVVVGGETIPQTLFLPVRAAGN